MNRFFVVGAALVSLHAHATTLVALDVETMAKASDAIVQGTVESVEPKAVAGGSRIVTQVTVKVSQTWKGSVPARIVVTQPGGVVGNIGQHVSGVATFEVGEEVVAFLEARGANYIVTGMVQGKYRVERSPDGKSAGVTRAAEADALLIDPATRAPVAFAPTSLPLADLRAVVFKALAVPAPVPTEKPSLKVP